MVNICDKCMQAFVTDAFLGKTPGGEGEKYETHSGMSSCLCNPPMSYVLFT